MSHIEMMQLAEKVARQSVCKRAQVGAVVAKSGYYYTGHNHNGMACCEGADGRTLPNVIHAEADALKELSRCQKHTAGGVLYVTRQPCIKCAELIVKAGISAVYYRDADDKLDGLKWLKLHGIAVDGSWITGQVAQDWADRNEVMA